MHIEHFKGIDECNNIELLPQILEKKTEKGVNEFWISEKGDYPLIGVLTNQNYAYVHYFKEEGEPGFQVISNENVGLDLKGTTVFYTNTDKEEVYIPNNAVITIGRAIEIVSEFFLTNKMPKCIEWTEL